MATQKGWKVDVNQCVGCRACEATCKIEYGLNAGQGRRRRVVEKTVVESGTARTFFISLACNHCENPACIAACPKSKTDTFEGDALFKDDGATLVTSAATKGVVMVNPDNCIGCRRCEWACPYGAPQYKPGEGGAVGVITKCELCWQRVANTNLHSSRQVPACQATCLGGSIKLMDVDPAVQATTLTNDTAFLKPDESTSHTTASPFVSPGETGRGSAYVADWESTHPSLRIRNRKYLGRDGALS